MKIIRLLLVVSIVALGLNLAGAAGVAGTSTATNAAANPTDGWRQTTFKYDIQHPYDLKASDRYDFDATNNIHHFWVFFTDKPHAPPPNQTTARTEMKLENFSADEHMFDADVKIAPGTFACIAQVFDAKKGPVTMVIAHPDGTVTIGHDTIQTHAIGDWWNLKLTNDPREGGKIRVYVDNVLAATYDSRGPREYYFKCGVYSRKNSDRSEVWYRNIKEWVKDGELNR